MIWGKTSGANFGFLKVAFGDQVDPNSTLDETSILTLKAALRLGN